MLNNGARQKDVKNPKGLNQQRQRPKGLQDKRSKSVVKLKLV